MIDLLQLNKYVREGYIYQVKHPIWDLFIFNYSPKTSQEAFWNEVTLTCRGLILNQTMQVVALPIRKFFEIEQLNNGVIPQNVSYTVSEKIDGSLGILYWHNGQPYITSRGRFDSFQALLATNILYEKYKNSFHLLDSKLNYFFEIIAPDNRNIVDYGNIEDLYLLGANDTQTGLDINVDEIDHPFPVPKTIDLRIEDIDDFLTQDDNLEGFVVKYANGFRIKYKSQIFNQRFDRYSAIKAQVAELYTAKFNKIDIDSHFNESEEVKYAHWIQNQIEEVLNYSLWIINKTDNNAKLISKEYPQLYRSIINFKKGSDDNQDVGDLIKEHVWHQIKYSQYFSERNAYNLSVFD